MKNLSQRPFSLKSILLTFISPWVLGLPLSAHADSAIERCLLQVFSGQYKQAGKTVLDETFAAGAMAGVAVNELWGLATLRRWRLSGSPRALNEFDAAEFKRLKDDYLARLIAGENLAELPIRTLNEQMALLEVARQQGKIDEPIDVIEILTKGNKKQKKQLIALAKSMDFSKGLSDPDKVMQMGRDLWKLQHMPDDVLEVAAQYGYRPAIDQWVETHMISEIAGAGDTVEAFRKLGLLGEPKRVGVVRKALRKSKETLKTLFFNYSFFLGNFMPYYFPQARFSKFKELLPEMMQVAETQGIDAIYPYIQSVMGPGVEARAVYDVIRESWSRVLLADLVYVSYVLVDGEIKRQEAVAAQNAETKRKQESLDHMVEHGLGTTTEADVIADYENNARAAGMSEDQIKKIIESVKKKQGNSLVSSPHSSPSTNPSALPESPGKPLEGSPVVDQKSDQDKGQETQSPPQRRSTVPNPAAPSPHQKRKTVPDVKKSI